MSNSLLLSSDRKSMYLISKRNEDRLFINGNGILLSVLGNSITACEVAAELRTHVNDQIENQDPFFELDITDEAKNHLTLSYHEGSNTLYVIGITDIVGSIPVGNPGTIKPEHILSKRVKLKASNNAGITSSKVVYAKTEIDVETGSGDAPNSRRATKNIKLFLIDA